MAKKKVEVVETEEVEADAPKDARRAALEERRAKKAKAAESKAKAKKSSEPKRGLMQKAKEVTGELKKVTWPTFGQVVKTTGIVIAVVLICALVLLGIERLLSLGYQGLSWMMNGGR